MKISLQDLGLSNKEAKVYQALLENNALSVIDITKKANINRTTGYSVLSSLEKKGLVGKTRKLKRVLYIAEDPQALSQYAAKQLQAWQNRLEQINKITPELKAIYHEPITKPRVSYYEGIDGLKKIYEDSLLCREKEIRSYTSTETLKNVMGEYAEEYFRRRTAQKISIRSIATYDSYGVHLKKVGKEYLREIRLIPRHKYAITTEIYIYDNKVAYLDLKEKLGVLIEGQEIVKAEKRIYELAWESAKKYDVKDKKN